MRREQYPTSIADDFTEQLRSGKIIRVDIPEYRFDTASNPFAFDADAPMSLSPIAQNQTMEPSTQLTYINVAGYYGVKFKHNAGENRNNHDVALLFKDDKMYKIEEQFNYSSTNPYPNIIDQTLNTIE